MAPHVLGFPHHWTLASATLATLECKRFVLFQHQPVLVMLTDAGLDQNMMLVTLVTQCWPQHHIVNQPYVLSTTLFTSEGDVCVFV